MFPSPLLLETIQVKNQQLQNISYHNQRFNRSRRELLGIEEEADLEDLIREYLTWHRCQVQGVRLQYFAKKAQKSGGYKLNKSRITNIQHPITNHESLITNHQSLTTKCRILYDFKIHKIEFVPYTLKKIQSLQLVIADEIDYSHKYANRTALQYLLQKKGKADDVLIVKNGWLTDTSYSNVAFFDGLQWFTPSKPLLKGTKRAALLQQKKIIEADIRPQDLKQFEKVRLVNAMMEWEEGVELEVDKNILIFH